MEDTFSDIEMVEIIKALNKADYTIQTPPLFSRIVNSFVNVIKIILCCPHLSSDQMEVFNITIGNLEHDKLTKIARLAITMNYPVIFDEEKQILKIYYVHKKSYILAGLRGKHPRWMDSYFSDDE